ncbi:MAG: hypothetical protein A3H82_02615 [Candidatus Levybacteria bacterium RIFCSPLOWO2_02_FULL_39_26]|nr:MAG: hypothetical protein A3H82_02615 [Candidatus Levybacteria bacterium RIFCSPLOWO2_02_FULL_39_26]
MDQSLIDELKRIIKGEIITDSEEKIKYSRDTSIFEVEPSLVIYPKDSLDIQNLVRFVKNHKNNNSLSITARSAGTDMTGGPLTDSILIDFTKHINKFIKLDNDYAVAEPGMYYRDFEKKTLEKNLYMPSYPASREMCAIGGIISNNAGGERTLQYGKTNKYLLGVNLILADGKEYYFEKLNKTELDKKMTLETFEGQVYKKTFELISKNKELIEKSRPKVSKNSSGYNIWDVWDGHNFDLTQLICGAQGTLGIITRAKLGLVKRKKYNHLYVVFFKTLLTLPQFTREVLRLKPTSLEVTDDHTFKIYLRYAKEMAEILGSKSIFSTIKLFMPEFLLTIKSGVPKLILLVEFEGNEEVSVLKNIEQIKQLVKQYKLSGRFCKTDLEAQKYWKLRRDTFKLLREKIKDKHATPFIDDISINPSYLPEFIPALTKILDEHKILYTISGHLGDGNLHVIPLMDLSKEEERKKIYEVTDLVYDLILKHQGTLSAEHNDGLIRSPYLEKEFGLKVYNLFKQIKETFDPDNIFNPHKKIGVTKEYAMSHMIKDESYIQKHPHEKI